MSENIKRLRERAGITQKELAKRLHISLSAVGMWECGQRTPRAKMLPALADALNCGIDDLYAHEQLDL